MTGFDAARTLAMLLVFVYHYGATFHLPAAEASLLAILGPYGTNLLLIVSGYFTYQSLVKRKEVGKFIVRRFFRLQAPLILIIALYLVLFTLVPERSKLPEDAWSAALIIASNLLLLGGLYTTPLITVTWTVSYIFLFTVLYSFAYYVLRQWRLSRYTIFAGYCSLVLLSTYTPYGRVRFLVAGAAVAHFDMLGRPLVLKLVTGLAVIGTVVAALLQLPPTSTLQAWCPLMLMFVICCAAPPLLRRWFDNPFVTFIGSRSFSFYLTHSLALHICYEAFRHSSPALHTTAFQLPVALGVAVVMCAIFDRFVDRKVAANPFVVLDAFKSTYRLILRQFGVHDHVTLQYPSDAEGKTHEDTRMKSSEKAAGPDCECLTFTRSRLGA